jgi:hypothetical protein
MASIFDLLNFKRKKDEGDVTNLLPSSNPGTEIFSNEFFEEYLQELRGKEGVKIYDQMRRSSDQINMLLTLCKTPIINATWSVDYREDTDLDRKIKAFIEDALFEQINFKQFIEEVLTMLEFGHSVFEAVYKPVIKHPTFPNSITLKKLSYISQKTIEEWHVAKSGDLMKIRQMVDGDLDVDTYIEASKLIPFSIGREGANYAGRSLLRPIYGNWKRKQAYLKIEAIGTERSSMGTPIGTLAQGAKDDQNNVLKKILSSFTSHQRSSVVVPHGTEIKNFDIGFKSPEIRATIDAERRGMSQSFLAGFMELGGASGAGSFALSTNLMQIFLGSLQLYADKITYEIDQKVIKALVDVNFGEQDVYPKLRATNITDRVGKEFVENLAALTGAGYLSATDEMKEFLRKKLNLPEAALAEEVEDNAEVTEPTPDAPTPDPIKKPVDMSVEFASKNKNEAVKLIDKGTKELTELMSTNLTERRDKLLLSTARLMKKKASRKDVIGQKFPDAKAYRDLVFDSLVGLSIQATNQAKKEAGVGSDFATKDELSQLTTNTKERLRAEVGLILDAQEADLGQNLYFPYNNTLDNTDSDDKVLEDMKEGSSKFLAGPALALGAANFAANAVNNARNDVYQIPEVIAGLESFTLVNPSPTAPICKELAGRTITKEQYLNGDLPPYHHRCNTIVVANREGAQSNPKVNPLGLAYTGTPDQVTSIIKSKTF